MRKTLTVILFAALSAFAATPVFAHLHDDSAFTVDAEGGDPFTPHRASHPASGFGRLAPDSLVECFGRCDAGAVQ